MIGGPGAGKFTLGRRLAARYGFQLISPSDVLRSEVDSGSERGQRFEEIMGQGRHVPADVIVQLVEEEMMTHPNDVGYLVVGFPRDRRQVIPLTAPLPFASSANVQFHEIYIVLLVFVVTLIHQSCKQYLQDKNSIHVELTCMMRSYNDEQYLFRRSHLTRK